MSEYHFVLDELGLNGIRPRKFEKNFTGTAKGRENTNYSYLGTPVFTSLELVDPRNENLRILLDSVVMDVSQSRNIVSTSIQGRNGSVKEYISDGDYSVTIRGVLTNNQLTDENYPQKAVQRLLNLCRLNHEVKAVSDFLLIFNIHNLVIQGYTINQSDKQGYENLQSFSLNCISDTSFELNLDKDFEV